MAPAFATPAALARVHPLHAGCSLTPRAAPLVVQPPAHRRPRAPFMSTTVRARDARSGERLVLTRVPAAPPLGIAPLVLCPSCHAAFNGAALETVARVRCSLCSHEFEADPTALYMIAEAASASTNAVKLPPRPADSIRCPHFTKCPGCQLEKRTHDPPIASGIGAFVRHLGFRGRWNVRAEDSHGWRTYAKLAVRKEHSRLRIGLYRPRSHEVIPLDSCAVHAPEINATVAAVQAVLDEAGTTAYSEATGDGSVRYILLALQRHTRRVQLTLVWNASNWKESQPHAQRVAANLWRLHGRTLLHSVWFNWNTSSANTIVSPSRERFYRAFGEEYLIERVLGHDMYFAPYAFRQANLSVFEKHLLPTLLSYIPVDSAVAEFCAGVGVIGLSALKQGRLRRLVASEVNPAAKELFWKSLRASRPPAGKQAPEVEFHVGSDSETQHLAHDDVDIVIVDPPRAGLSPELVETLANPPPVSRLKRIIYVSCGFDAFRTQAEVLVKTGRWRLVGAEGFVLFPGVDHVEILAIFDRVKVSRSALAPPRVAGKSRGKNSKSAWNHRAKKAAPVDTTKRKYKDSPRGTRKSK